MVGHQRQRRSWLWHVDAARIAKHAPPVDEIDAVARQMIEHQVTLAVDDSGDARRQVPGDQLIFRGHARIRPTRRRPAQRQHPLAQSLARERAGVHRRATKPLRSIDECHAFAELGSRNGSALSRRSAADHDEIVMLAHRPIDDDRKGIGIGGGQGSQALGKGRRRVEAMIEALLERARDDMRQSSVGAVDQVAQTAGRRREHGRQRIRDGGPLESTTAGQHLEQHAAEPEDVSLRGHLAAT